jgi:microcystin-dependent protein
MACSNCYNGCAEIISDRCVKYTGLDVPALGIQNGDSLSLVEASLIEFLTNALTGVSIIPTINQVIICETVSKYLPDCGEFNLNAYITALIQAACDIQEQVDILDGRVNTIEASYSVGCLTGVSSNSGTHAILQAVITRLCAIDVNLAALALDVDTNYVKIADLNDLIQAYLDSIASSTQYYTKMVPYTAVEYYGSLSYFDATGAGLGDWEKIYLCNGQNGTPDKRGRVPVGAIQLVPGGALNAAVNPATPGNPNYAVGDVAGANTITLDATQIPSHTHGATVTDNHYHFEYADVVNTVDSTVDATSYVARALNLASPTELEYTMNSSPTVPTVGRSGGTQGSISVSNASTGGGLAHANIQPVLACYYIMYIP